MNATSLYVSTCRLVLQANPEDPGCWADLYRLIPYLRQSLSCTVCGNLLIEPYTPTETNCQHHVCRSCKGGKKKLKPSCSWCKNYEKYVENVQLRILLQCYKKLCEYIINSSIYRLMCKTTASGDTNIANMTDLIQEGAGFKDEFKSNSGLSKSAYSILPCIYASASTQTITQAINLNNDSDIAIDEDVSVAKSNLSNGSSIYSVTYAGSGNKMVIKRKAMLNKGEMENCENLRLIKGSNFKRPIHRRGNFRGRGRGFKEDDKTNNTGVSNCAVSTNNVNSGRVNVKKKKLGCRCGNATASPGKLTCCGQRCPCYVDSKACLDCKCRGCRNPHTKEGQKVIRDPIDSASKLQSPAQLQTDEGIPNKSNAHLTESVSNATQKKWSCEVDPVRRPKKIIVTVESIENVDESKVKEVMVMVDFIGSILNQSYQTPIIKSRADIDLTTAINVDYITEEFRNTILANPIVFTVFDCTMPGPVSTATAIPSPSVEIKKKMSKSSSPPASGSKSFMSGLPVLGICNLDIGSLAMGEKRIKQTLVVESEKKLTPLEKVVERKLPKLVVVVSTGEEPLTPKSITKFNNVLSITVESVYNVPDYISEGRNFEASIQVPTIGEKACRIKFPNGVATSVKEFTCRKKWVNLSDIEGPGARSKYRILPEACDVISDLPGKVVLDTDLTKPQKTIRWNMWRSCLMHKGDVNHFYQKILKYSVWPIEISLPNKSKEQIQKEKSAKSDKKSKPMPSASVTSGDHFTAFLNLSPFLHPGETRLRVAAQLLTYSQADLVSKFGMEVGSLQVQASIATVKGKTASERSKASSVRDFEEMKDIPGTPVCGPDGSPTFIIVEIELLKPLTQKRDPEIVEEDLKTFASIKGKMKKKTRNLGMMESNFSQTILDVVSTLTKEYQTFSDLNNTPEEHKPDDINFYDFFCKRKNFYRVRATLEQKIVDVIQEKYGSLDQLEKKMPSVYAYLVNEMHKVTNHYMAVQDLSFPHFNTAELQLYSEEALEEGEFELAKEYLFLRLSRNTSNPDYWLDIATYCIRLNTYEKAIEAVREALCLNFYHQIGLLMYALIMAYMSDAKVGEMAFEVLLTKYPNFVEGWMALQFFHITFGNPEAATIARRQVKILENERNCPTVRVSSPKLSEAKQVGFCLDTYKNEKYEPAAEEKYGVASFVNGVSWSEALSWTTTVCPPDNIRLRTTILLLKLGFYQFASMCLSDELLSSEEEDKQSPALVYYTCVNYYLQRRYEDAVPLLQKYAKEYGQDCFIWSLLGHCYFKLENHTEAIACYEYVIQSFNRPDDIHLVYSRMGFYYLEANKYPCARHTLQTACKYSQTPRLWKGVGICCLMMEDFEDAEVAFTEANYLDNKDPETWAYLAITNSLLRRLDLFKNCYSEARKRGLSNKELIKKIKCFARVNGLTDEEFKC